MLAYINFGLVVPYKIVELNEYRVRFGQRHRKSALQDPSNNAKGA